MKEYSKVDFYLKYKNVLDYIKDSPTIIIMLFSFLGGNWQLIQLSTISLSYIRFFSITQIIPDGLILVIGFIIFILIAIIMLYINLSIVALISNIPSNKLKVFLKNKIYELKFYGWYTLFFIIIFSSVILYHFYFMMTSKFSLSGFKFLLINLFIYLQVLVFFEYLLRFVNKEMKRISLVIYMNLGCVCLYFFLIMVLLFNNKYLMPTNLKNFDKVKNKLIKENPNSKVQILYFNDKYLFAKIHNENIHKNSNDTIDKIEIINFEDIPTKP